MAGRVWFGGLRVRSLLFVDNMVPLASSNTDLQHTLEKFVAECDAARTKIGTSKSKARKEWTALV